MQQSLCYTLPSSPELTCVDRFDILDRDDPDGLVPFWCIVTKLLQREISSVYEIIDVLETIVLTLERSPLHDYHVLKNILASQWASFTRIWPCLRELALELPHLFPTHQVPMLLSGGAELRLTRRQAACLVVHQFLGTLPTPSTRDEFFDFSIWYSSNQPHINASTIYLTSILTYFERLASNDGFSPLDSTDWDIKFRIYNGAVVCKHDNEFRALHVQHLPQDLTHTCQYGLPDGACVVSANKVVGFGQSGTQEERHVAASPESCPIALITPPLRESDVLVVTGAEAMIAISGHGRHIELGEQLDVGDDPVTHRLTWQNRAMLFADALELDGYSEPLPDLMAGNVKREFDKALTAFASGTQKYSKIMTGLWGCGAFGGNPAVKALIQWSAASTAGVPLVLTCSNHDHSIFGEQLIVFVDDVLAEGVSIEELMKSLEDLRSEDFTGCQTDDKNQAVFEALKLRLKTS